MVVPAHPPASGILFHDLVLATRGDGCSLLEPLLGHFPQGMIEGEVLPLALELLPTPTAAPRGELLASKEGVELRRNERGFVIGDTTSWATTTLAPLSVRGQLTSGGAAREVAATALLLALRSRELYELHAAAGAPAPDWYDIATVEWASRWPAEDLWVARKA